MQETVTSRLSSSAIMCRVTRRRLSSEQVACTELRVLRVEGFVVDLIRGPATVREHRRRRDRYQTMADVAHLMAPADPRDGAERRVEVLRNRNLSQQEQRLVRLT